MHLLCTAYERFCTNFPTRLIVLNKQSTDATPVALRDADGTLHPAYMAMEQMQVNNLIDAVAHLTEARNARTLTRADTAQQAPSQPVGQAAPPTDSTGRTGGIQQRATSPATAGDQPQSVSPEPAVVRPTIPPEGQSGQLPQDREEIDGTRQPTAEAGMAVDDGDERRTADSTATVGAERTDTPGSSRRVGGLVPGDTVSRTDGDRGSTGGIPDNADARTPATEAERTVVDAAPYF